MIIAVRKADGAIMPEIQSHSGDNPQLFKELIVRTYGGTEEDYIFVEPPPDVAQQLLFGTETHYVDCTQSRYQDGQFSIVYAQRPASPNNGSGQE